jgi:hypothetical protein
MRVLKSNRLNLVSGSESKGFFYLAIASSADYSSFSSFFLGSSFLG